MLRKTDVAVVVADASRALNDTEKTLVRTLEERGVPYVIAYNKSDLAATPPAETANSLAVSAVTGQNVDHLKEKLASLVKTATPEKRLVGDLLSPEDVVVLVTPIDEAAPKGRLILPQQQTIRDILDADAVALVTKEHQLEATLQALGAPPRMVITDSQVFERVAAIVPDDIPLTSFSILFARYKGNVAAVQGAAALDRLQDGDTVLISEGCTHHRQCGDIGTVKLPAWIRKHCGKDIRFEFTSGGTFPDDLSPYALIVHCGGCMLNDREMLYRAKAAKDGGVPMTNYGMAIAHMHGILRRSLSVFPDWLKD